MKHFNPAMLAGAALAASAARGIQFARAEATPDIKALIDTVQQRMAAFVQADEARYAELKRGLADVVSIEKVDRIHAELCAKYDEAQAAIAAHAEQMASLARSAPSGKDRDRDWKRETQAFLAGRAGVTEVAVSDADVERYRKYDDTFARFLRHGDREPEVWAAMQVGSDPSNGYWVTTQKSDDWITRLRESSAMRELAQMMSITTDSVSFPVDTDDATSGGWVGETDPRGDTATPAVGEQTIYVREQFAQPKVTQKLLDMATIDPEAWLMRKLTDKLSRVENTAFVLGTGVKQPRGFLDYRSAAVTTADASRAWGKLQYIASGAAGGFPALSGIPGASDADALISVIAAMNPAYLAGANWAMSRATLAAIRKLKDGQGRYLVGFGDIRETTRGFDIFGFPVALMEDMPALGSDSFSVAFGNFAVGYLIVDGRGIRVLRDPFTDKPYVIFYTTKWTGGDVTNFDAIKLVKFASS